MFVTLYLLFLLEYDLAKIEIIKNKCIISVFVSFSLDVSWLTVELRVFPHEREKPVEAWLPQNQS